MDAPVRFTHSLDPDLFALDRLDALFRRAPEGRAKVQIADESRERAPGSSPRVTTLEARLADDVLRRPLYVSFQDLTAWAPEYAEARDHVFAAADGGPTERRYNVEVVIRVFTPNVPKALHGDGEIQLDCGDAGRTSGTCTRPACSRRR